MKLKQLEALRAVVQAGTTKDAGEIVLLTQSAVSKLISQLEDELNTQLFFRRAGRMMMTPEGRMIYEDVQRVLQLTDRLREKTRDVGALRTSRLRLATMPALGHGLLPRALQQLNEEFPHTLCVIDEEPRQRIEDQVASGYYDLGFVTLPVQNDKLETISVGTANAVCVMPKDHPLIDKSEVDITDMEDQTVISVGPDTLLRHRTDALFGQHQIRRRLTIQAPNSTLACKFVAAGNGISLVHPLIALSNHEKVAIRPFTPGISLQYAILKGAGAPSMAAARMIEISKQILHQIEQETNSFRHFPSPSP